MRTFQNHIELHWDCTTKAWENTRNNMPERPDLDPREQIRLLMNGPAQEAPVMQPIQMFAVAELHEPEPDHDDDMVPFLEESDDSDTEDDFDDDQIDAMLDVTRLQHQNREEWQQVFYKTLRVWQVIFGVSQNAIRILLSILYTFLQLAGQDLIKKPPNSGDAINRVVPVDPDLVEMKTACLKCKTLYAEEETYDDNIGPDGKRTRTPKLCSYQEIPHGFGDESNECGNKLAKQKTNEHTKSLDKVPYARIAVQLRKMFQRPGFKEACQKWRTRANWLPKDVMADVYDGDVWQQDKWVEFWDESEYNVGLQLNLDWLEPHKSAQYSLGAIYLVILNLPRDIRYKRENIILVATLPDSSEHVGTTSRLVLPMVQQLIRLWDGEEEVIPGSGGELRCSRLLLICQLEEWSVDYCPVLHKLGAHGVRRNSRSKMVQHQSLAISLAMKLATLEMSTGPTPQDEQQLKSGKTLAHRRHVTSSPRRPAVAGLASYYLNTTIVCVSWRSTPCITSTWVQLRTS